MERLYLRNRLTERRVKRANGWAPIENVPNRTFIAGLVLIVVAVFILVGWISWVAGVGGDN